MIGLRKNTHTTHKNRCCFKTLKYSKRDTDFEFAAHILLYKTPYLQTDNKTSVVR